MVIHNATTIIRQPIMMESANKPSMTPGAATKAPHELLAVGVGVKPPYAETIPASAGGGGNGGHASSMSVSNGTHNDGDSVADATNIPFQVSKINIGIIDIGFICL